MPRKQLAHPTKKRSAHQATEQRKKNRADRTSPSRSIPAPRKNVPSSSRSSPIESKPVILGRRVDFNFLESEGFHLGQKLKLMGWETLCSLNLPTYPDLVREFYTNLKSGVGSLTSVVKGTQIDLNSEDLGVLLSMPTLGSTREFLQDRLEGLATILERSSVNPVEDLSAKLFSVEVRLLHHMSARIFFPRSGRFDFVSERDILLMHHVLKTIPLNLPFLMIKNIIEVSHKKKTTLPYGMVLTMVFEEFGISLEGERSQQLSIWDTYNEKTLLRMGFLKTDGKWTRKIEDPSAEQPEEPSAPSAPSAPAVPTEAGPSSAPIQPAPSSELVPHSSTLFNILGEMRTELSSLRTLLISQAHKIQDMEESQLKFQESVQRELNDLKTETGFLGSKILSSVQGQGKELKQFTGAMQETTSAVLKNLGDISDGVRMTLIKQEFQQASSSSQPPRR